MYAPPVAARRPASPRSAQPALDESRLVAWRNVRGVSRNVVDLISAEMESASGVPLDWYEVLLHLYEDGQGRLRQRELDRRSHLSQSAISRMVSKMVEAGLLRRETTLLDRRNVDVVMTQSGRDVFLRATPIHNAAVQHHFGAWLSDRETATINTGLKKIVRAVGSMSGKGGAELDELVTFGMTVFSLISDSVTVTDAILVRDALEPLLLVDAARHVNKETADRLRGSIIRMSTLIDDPEGFFRADWDLHRTVAELCQNTLLRTAYLNLLDVISSHMASVLPTSNLQQYLYERLAIHAQLVDAVASGDETQAAAAAQAHHFTSGRARLIAGTPADS
jgi:DNA-binding MarR family transcriptional regulator